MCTDQTADSYTVLPVVSAGMIMSFMDCGASCVPLAHMLFYAEIINDTKTQYSGLLPLNIGDCSDPRRQLYERTVRRLTRL